MSPEEIMEVLRIDAARYGTAPATIQADPATPDTPATPSVAVPPEMAGDPGINNLTIWASAAFRGLPPDGMLEVARSDPRNVVAFRLGSGLVRVDRLDDGQLARVEAGPPDLVSLMTYDVGEPRWGETEGSSGHLVVQWRDRSGYRDTRTIFSDGVERVESYRMDEVTLTQSSNATATLWRLGADLARCAEMARAYRGHLCAFAAGETLIRLDRFGSNQVIRRAVGRDGTIDLRAYRVGDPTWSGGLAVEGAGGISWMQSRHVNGSDQTRTILPDGRVDFRGGHDEDEIYESDDSRRRRSECVTRAGPRRLWKVADKVADLVNAKNRPRNLPDTLTETVQLLCTTAEAGKALRPVVTWGRRGRVPAQALAAARDAVCQLYGEADVCLGDLRRLSMQADKPPVVARDVFTQLRLLEREYGAVYHDPVKGKIAVVIGPIVLVDPKFTDIECDFGYFALALTYGNFGDRYIDTAAFSAYPVLGNVELRGEKGSGVPHPHVSGTGICMGTAAEPVIRALGEMRIFDAFLLVTTMLSAMGKQSHPYAHVWQYVYRKREMREMGYTVDDVDEEEIEEEIEEDEIDEEDGAEEDEEADEEADDDSIRCEHCEHRYDPGDGGQCVDCEHDYCSNCLRTCACGKDVCEDCKKTCADCQRVACQGCAVECGGCDQAVCVDCVTNCEVCSTSRCSGCRIACTRCESVFCETCHDDHMVACESCGAKHCGIAVDRCVSCHGPACPSCLVTPEWSLHASCPDCVATCTGCGRAFGAHELLAGRCPACARPDLRRFLDEERQYRARRAAHLEAGCGRDRDRAACVGDGAGGDPGHVLDPADVRHGGVCGRPGCDDGPAEAAGVLGGHGAGLPDDDAVWPSPAPEYAEREPFRLVIDGVVIERRIYPGLPLFNVTCWAERA